MVKVLRVEEFIAIFGNVPEASQKKYTWTTRRLSYGPPIHLFSLNYMTGIPTKHSSFVSADRADFVDRPPRKRDLFRVT